MQHQFGGENPNANAPSNQTEEPKSQKLKSALTNKTTMSQMSSECSMCRIIPQIKSINKYYDFPTNLHDCT